MNKAFTLLEFILVIALVGIAAAALVPALGQSLFRHAGLRRTMLACDLAMDMIEEIRAAAFEDPDLAEGSFGTEEGARSQYDDCDDYDGWSASPPEDKAGSAVSGHVGFTRSVVVENVAEDDYELGANAVGSPVRDHAGRVVAALSIAVPGIRFDEQRRQRSIDLILAACRQLSQRLGCAEGISAASE